MPTTDELHAKLEAIGSKIEQARQKLDFKQGLNDGHNLSSGELQARYEYLQGVLQKEVADLETQGKQVSALEQDVFDWLNSIDTRIS
ncbi:3-ketoacyl-ACP reductase [Roseibaca sp. Y0-43]|uniref:3-ketoacyl-ACP reductase n=1 Tax=Roseibaca sp. Y0-43 TaxID=2816854 RepID=UPI001D0BF9F6|nr:3-ketoacyl-ACP reductase [Roseibaca sp. Y0-43]MCC1482561.1 3-ketoacyl-ACP reductase [Roseibaca sp. Y0-43]